MLDTVAGRLRSASNIILLEPTTIDELRFPNSPFTGQLEDRWPAPRIASGNEIQLLWDGLDTPEERGRAIQPFIMDQADEDRESYSKDLASAAAMLPILLKEISNQINWRDRQLLEQSHGVVQLRPFASDSGKVSGGVAEEMELHRRLLVRQEFRTATKGVTKRIRAVVYHPDSDENRRRAGAITAAVARYIGPRGKVGWTPEMEEGLQKVVLDEKLYEKWSMLGDGAVGKAVIARVQESPFKQLKLQPLASGSSTAMNTERVKIEDEALKRELGQKVLDAISGQTEDRPYALARFTNTKSTCLIRGPEFVHADDLAAKIMGALAKEE